jgi:ornithine--oxo-acid transaminase
VNEENLAQNAAHLGEILRAGLNAARNPIITLVRKGLLNAIVVNCDEESDLAGIFV